jgi:hypothetical protein
MDHFLAQLSPLVRDLIGMLAIIGWLHSAYWVFGFAAAAGKTRNSINYGDG